MDNSLYKGVITGSAAITEQILFGNLMDMVKLEKQRTVIKTYPNIIKTFCKDGIIRGSLLGFFPWGILMYGGRGLFYGYGSSKSKESLLNSNYNIFQTMSPTNINILSSSIGGAIEGAITSPFAMIRTRIAENASTNLNISKHIKGSLKSVPFNSAKRATDWGLRSYFHPKFDTQFGPFSSAFISGLVSTAITTPIDRLLPVIQQNNPPKNICKWFIKNIKKNGMKSIYAGSAARILHGGWHTSFVFGSLHIFNTHYDIKY